MAQLDLRSQSASPTPLSPVARTVCYIICAFSCGTGFSINDSPLFLLPFYRFPFHDEQLRMIPMVFGVAHSVSRFQCMHLLYISPLRALPDTLTKSTTTTTATVLHAFVKRCNYSILILSYWSEGWFCFLSRVSLLQRFPFYIIHLSCQASLLVQVSPGPIQY